MFSLGVGHAVLPSFFSNMNMVPKVNLVQMMYDIIVFVPNAKLKRSVLRLTSAHHVLLAVAASELLPISDPVKDVVSFVGPNTDLREKEGKEKEI